ncbi:MAG: cold shock and DUF1294 domain-containing protein [Pseudomonadales bacterium]
MSTSSTSIGVANFHCRSRLIRTTNRNPRLSGQITTWKDDRGFGFITPRGGGEEVFVHISAFANRQRRPTGNEKVVYQTRTDAQGRTQAARVWFLDESIRRLKKKQPRSAVYALTLAGLFLALVAGLVITGRLPVLMLSLYLLASIVTAMVYAWDKSAARKARWRTAENTLHLLGLVGGWPGALVARHFFRHKSKKTSFILVFWATVVLNCIGLAWLMTPQGKDVLQSVIRAVALEV